MRRVSGNARKAQLVTVGEWLGYAQQRFHRAGLVFGHGTDNALDEAAWLILHVAGRPDEDLAGALHRALTPSQRRRVGLLIEQRIATRKPLAHLLREAWLGEHRFYVDERVIVPRSHIAELIANRFAPWIRTGTQIRRALDMCTGSGCLAVLLALAFPAAKVDAVDLSQRALAVARRNVSDYRLRRRVRLLRSDLFDGIEPVNYDLIVANPPYVSARTMAKLPPEYRHEPRVALDGGRDGLVFAQRILADARHNLAADGVLVVEVGSHRRALERAFPELPFVWLQTASGCESVFLLRRNQLPDGR